MLETAQRHPGKADRSVDTAEMLPLGGTSHHPTRDHQLSINFRFSSCFIVAERETGPGGAWAEIASGRCGNFVGRAIGEQMTAGLVLSALSMALQKRKPEDVIHHSDQGSQYTSVAFGERCKKTGVRPS